jgi:DNA modification methylase
LAKDDPLKAKEIGSESTPEAFIAMMVAVFREVRRVLRPDGCCFVDLGDTYDQGCKGAAMGTDDKQAARRFGLRATETGGGEIGVGQLLNIPHRVAEALRQDGWVWRQTIVWAKKSPMPESVAGWRWTRHKIKIAPRPNGQSQNYATGTRNEGLGRPEHSGCIWDKARWQDCPGCPKCSPHGGYVLRRGSGRCTTAHEYLFLMTKTNRYFWDAAASQEAATSTSGGACVGKNGSGTDRKVTAEENAKIRGGSRNMRSYWLLSSEPTSERHFATFPSELVRRCLAGGASHGGVCSDCGAPWAPVIEGEIYAPPVVEVGVRRVDDSRGDKTRKLSGADYARQNGRQATGYRPTCSCSAPATGALILDCFCGLGTTLQTARQLGMRGIGIDLNEKYLAIATKRVFKPPRWWLRQNKPKENRIQPHANQKSFLDLA